MKAWIPCILGVAFIVACGAPQQEGSSLASLDNALAGDSDKTLNACEGQGDAALLMSRVEGAGDAKLTQVLAGSLAAIPEPLARAFVGLGGRIRLTTDTASVCGEAVKGCWRVEDGGTATIYLRAEPVAIRHAAVRSFGYVLAQLLSRVHESGESFVIDERQPAFAKAAKRLSDALARDLAAAKTQGAAQLDDDQVFAESFDSYYCSAKTRQAMARDYPRTFGVFRGMMRDLEGGDALALTSGKGIFDVLLGLVGSLFGGGGGAGAGAGGKGGAGGGGILDVLLGLFGGLIK